MRASKTERSRPSVILSKPEETDIQKEYRFPFAFISLKKIATSLEISLPELMKCIRKRFTFQYWDSGSAKFLYNPKYRIIIGAN